MKITLLAAALAALVLAGCNNSAPAETTPETAPPTETTSKTPETPAVQVAYDLGSIKKGDKANCVICCAGGTGHGEEPAAEVIDFEGKTYAFCNESEKATFISDPAKYAKK